MTVRVRTLSIIALAVWLGGLLSSCNDGVAYHHYERIADEGWDVRDTVAFQIDSIMQDGSYNSAVCIRTNAQYPYRNLSLMVYQTIFHKNDSLPTFTKGRTILATIPVEIKQEDGIATGQGVTYFTYEVPYMTSSLQQGDSLSIVVRHHMRREVLPGITDIGIKLTKN